jgi:hypothetical protein
MMKFIFVLALTAVALAAENVAECKTQLGSAGKSAQCAPCDAMDFTAGACKTASVGDDSSLECAFFKKCVDDVREADKKAKQALCDNSCPTDKKDCKDSDAYCPTWAKATPTSECEKNPEWMCKNCQNSCCNICTGKNLLGTDVCPTEDEKSSCADNSADPKMTCQKWADAGECTKNSKWMIKNCMRSCCDECKILENGCPAAKPAAGCENDHDDDKECAAWAKAGECTKNSKWMMANCQIDCCPACLSKPPARATIVYQQPIYQQPVQLVAYQQPMYQQQAVYQQPIQQRVAAPAFGSYGSNLPYIG